MLRFLRSVRFQDISLINVICFGSELRAMKNELQVLNDIVRETGYPCCVLSVICLDRGTEWHYLSSKTRLIQNLYKPRKRICAEAWNIINSSRGKNLISESADLEKEDLNNYFAEIAERLLTTQPANLFLPATTN